MLRSLLIATLMGLFIFCLMPAPPAHAQLYWSMSLSAASQNDLPVQTATYQAGAHKFNWTFSWHNQYHSPADAFVYPRVVSSNMTVEANNGMFGDGDRKLTGSNDSGYPSDYLQISQAGGSVPGRFTNMVFEVIYINENEQ
jgi:hypothetical protein